MYYLLSRWDNEGRVNTTLVQEPAHLNISTPVRTQLTRSITTNSSNQVSIYSPELAVKYCISNPTVLSCRPMPQVWEDILYEHSTLLD